MTVSLWVEDEAVLKLLADLTADRGTSTRVLQERTGRGWQSIDSSSRRLEDAGYLATGKILRGDDGEDLSFALGVVTAEGMRALKEWPAGPQSAEIAALVEAFLAMVQEPVEAKRRSLLRDIVVQYAGPDGMKMLPQVLGALMQTLG